MNDDKNGADGKSRPVQGLLNVGPLGDGPSRLVSKGVSLVAAASPRDEVGTTEAARILGLAVSTLKSHRCGGTGPRYRRDAAGRCWYARADLRSYAARTTRRRAGGQVAALEAQLASATERIAALEARLDEVQAFFADRYTPALADAHKSIGDLRSANQQAISAWSMLDRRISALESRPTAAPTPPTPPPPELPPPPAPAPPKPTARRKALSSALRAESPRWEALTRYDRRTLVDALIAATAADDDADTIAAVVAGTRRQKGRQGWPAVGRCAAAVVDHLSAMRRPIPPVLTDMMRAHGRPVPPPGPPLKYRVGGETKAVMVDFVRASMATAQAAIGPSAVHLRPDVAGLTPSQAVVVQARAMSMVAVAHDASQLATVEREWARAVGAGDGGPQLEARLATWGEANLQRLAQINIVTGAAK